MLHTVEVIIMVVAVICLFLAALGKPEIEGRVNLGWLGLALWATVVALGVIS